MGYEIPRNDKNFNLDNVTDEQLFEGLNKGIFECVKQVKYFEDIAPEDIRLKADSYRKYILGEDGNMYPQIVLYTRTTPKTNWIFATNIDFLVTPFSIKMVVFRNGIDESEPEELQEALTKFMCETFPGGDYLNKKQEYLEKTRKAKTFYDKMIFENL